MSARKKIKIKNNFLFISLFILPMIAIGADNTLPASHPLTTPSLAVDAVARQLGWVPDKSYYCGGYYFEQPLIYPITVSKDNPIAITTEQGILSQRSTSILEGKVTVTRRGQQMTANKAYLYRNATTGKLTAIDLIGDVNLRDATSFIIGKKGYYNFDTDRKTLFDLMYRTQLNLNRPMLEVAPEQLLHERRIASLTAWGEAEEISQTEPLIYEMTRGSYTTCPPISPAWSIRSSHIVLNKNTGRGYATNVRLLVKSIPVLYLPYLNFSIDHQRKSGFLWPSYSGGNQTGPSVYTPFYWNMAPNYDMTITPGFLSYRGVLISDNFRYLTPTTYGSFFASVLPADRAFAQFKKDQKEKYANSDNPTTQAELRRLQNYSTTRRAFIWRENSRFNEHWSSHVDFNYVGDDYYLRNLGNNLNEVTANQLLEEADLNYQSKYWNFIGRLQTYQTLHPIDESPVENQYRRLPQLILNADYPNLPFGFEFFFNKELTHFDIRNTPGTQFNKPIGNRYNLQPGISLPFYKPYFFFNPRFQFAFTQYELKQTADTNTPPNKRRALPIFDVASGLAFYRNAVYFNYPYQHTLEPQIYYTYIPYRNQASIPIFDTTVSTLVYDQLFNYNRFSGLDRIGDANQIAIGVTSRLIDENTGLEKVRAGIGEIVYFANRHVTFCNDNSCTDNSENNPSNKQRLSPISGTLSYLVNTSWSMRADAIWNPITRALDNATLSFHYQPEYQHIVNFGYTYAHGGDILSGIVDRDDPRNNLKVTLLSFAWPLVHDISAVGLWSQNWNQAHLQNLIFGLQYDTCCWGVRVVAGRAFTGIDPNNNQPKFNTEGYIQFALKGLGEVGTGHPGGLLNSITGYDTHFGQQI